MRFFQGDASAGRAVRAGVVGLVTLLLVSGCAYFNTFYHARKFYNQAEDKRREAEAEGREVRDALELYDKSIKKCAKIIVEHSDSKWVDDALLMMGNGFFHRGEYTRALRKYEELITYYPESPFRDEALWMSARTEYELGNVDRSRAVFRQIAEQSKDAERREEARVMIARSWEAHGRHARCIEEIEALLGEEHEPGAPAYLVLGDCYRASHDFASAKPMYERAALRSDKPAERFEAQLRAAEALREMGRTDETRQFYTRLMKKQRDPVRRGKLRLAMGRLLVSTENIEEALEMFREVADEPDVQSLAGEAQYEIGRVYELFLGDLEKAVEAYEAVNEKRPEREVGDRARARKDHLTQLITYLEERDNAPPDSLPILDFKMAELYLFELDRPERAVERYQSVVRDSTDETRAAKALLGIAWIRESVEGDSAEAVPVYEKLVELYPETEYADRAREILGLPPRPKPEPVDTLATDISAPVDSLGGGEDTTAVDFGVPPRPEVTPPDSLESTLPRIQTPRDSLRADVPARFPEARPERPPADSVSAPDTPAADGTRGMMIPEIPAQGDSVEPAGVVRPPEEPGMADSVRVETPAIRAATDSATHREESTGEGDADSVSVKPAGEAGEDHRVDAHADSL